MKNCLRVLLATIYLWCIPEKTFCQSSVSDWKEYLQQLAEEGVNTENLEAMYDELSDIEAHPFNLNEVDLSDLSRLPFLSEDQQQSIMQYLDKNKPVYSVYELRNVPHLDLQTVQLLLPFFYVGKYKVELHRKSLLKLLKEGKNELQFRFDKVFPRRAGYKTVADSILAKYPNRVYQGEDFYHSVRYGYTAGRKLQAGFVAEKDAGEPFWTKSHKGYDYYGAYIVLRNIGHWKTVVAGNYRLAFGQGLVLSNNFYLAKSSLATSVARRTSLPTKYMSNGEAGYFRGLAAAYGFNDFTLTAFISYKDVDANLRNDSIITSFKTDGLHRTQLEISKKNNVTEQVGGANLQYVKDGMQIGFSFLYNHYNRKYDPVFQEYNRFYFRGNQNANASLDYSYRFRRFSLAGETAVSKNGSFATLHILNFYAKQGVTLSVLQRQYARSYQALYANAFSDGSSVQNESGWYFGSQIAPSARLRLSTYIDMVSFPWVKYGINAPSRSYDYFIQGAYDVNFLLQLVLRYRFREREKNVKDADSKIFVQKNSVHKVLLQAIEKFSLRWSGKTILDWNWYKSADLPAERGLMVSQMLSWQAAEQWKVDWFAAYFKADSYQVRVYSRERSLTNNFYMPSVYGEGIRSSASIRYQWQRGLSISLKCGLSKYFDKNTIGTGLEKIDASHRLDLVTYVRWRF